jgi:hypothetical protein
MSESQKLVVVAVPRTMMADANWLAVFLGRSRADIETFVELNFAKPEPEEMVEDYEADAYCVRSFLADDAFFDALSKPLVAPSYWEDADIAAATRAQEAVTQDGEARADAIVMKVDMPIPDALAAFNVEPYSETVEPVQE